jgi:NAD-dependent deacetylase sirtuin 4
VGQCCNAGLCIIVLIIFLSFSLDYRSAGIGLYAKTNRRPVQHQDFIRFASARQRYWARNFVGWPRFSSFLPNPTHQCLADWEKRDRLDYLITQNVDKLHHRAGSQRCIELHGTSHTVACLSCHKKLSRFDFQQILSDANPAWNVEWLQEQLAPDGDVLLPDDEVQRFVVSSNYALFYCS